MNANYLERLSGRIKFTAGSGYSSDTNYRGEDPVAVALEMVDELARVLAISGKAEDVVATVNDAIARVKADLKTQESA